MLSDIHRNVSPEVFSGIMAIYRERPGDAVPAYGVGSPRGLWQAGKDPLSCIDSTGT